jgi:hypothetical protein
MRQQFVNAPLRAGQSGDVKELLDVALKQDQSSRYRQRGENSIHNESLRWEVCDAFDQCCNIDPRLGDLAIDSSQASLDLAHIASDVNDILL